MRSIIVQRNQSPSLAWEKDWKGSFPAIEQMASKGIAKMLKGSWTRRGKPLEEPLGRGSDGRPCFRAPSRWWVPLKPLPRLLSKVLSSGSVFVGEGVNI